MFFCDIIKYKVVRENFVHFYIQNNRIFFIQTSLRYSHVFDFWLWVMFFCDINKYKVVRDFFIFFKRRLPYFFIFMMSVIFWDIRVTIIYLISQTSWPFKNFRVFLITSRIHQSGVSSTIFNPLTVRIFTFLRHQRLECYTKENGLRSS